MTSSTLGFRRHSPSSGHRAQGSRPGQRPLMYGTVQCEPADTVQRQRTQMPCLRQDLVVPIKLAVASPVGYRRGSDIRPVDFLPTKLAHPALQRTHSLAARPRLVIDGVQGDV